MNLATLAFFLLGVLGASWTLAFGAIAQPLRGAVAKIPILGKLVRCPPCSSFWIGGAIAYFGYGPVAGHSASAAFFAAIACTGFSAIFAGTPASEPS